MKLGPAQGRRRLQATDALSAVFRTEPSHPTFDIALIAIRIALVWVFIYYGAQKFFGAFNGPGFHGTAVYFAHTAHLRPGGLFAVLGGVTEFCGGIAIALGFFSRFAALALFADQVIAMITVTWATGFGSLSKGGPGYQFNITVAVLALVVVVVGPGRFSVDTLISRRLRAAGVDRSAGSPTSASEHFYHQDQLGQQVASPSRSDDPH